MKYSVIFLLFFIFILNCNAEEIWEPVTGIEEPVMREVIANPYDWEIIYASSEKRLYRSEDSGKTWAAVFYLEGGPGAINFIGISVFGIFVCTDNGLFKSKDGKSDWKRVFKGRGAEEKRVMHINFSQERIFIGTGNGLFVSADKGSSWEKDTGGLGNIGIRWIESSGGNIYVAAENGVYRDSDSGWERIFTVLTEESQYDAGEADSNAMAIRPVNSILSLENKIFLATDAGIFFIEGMNNNWSRFASTGLLTGKIKKLLFKDCLYAVTDKGIFVFDKQCTVWRVLYNGMSTNKVNSASMDNRGVLWVATSKGLYMAVPETKGTDYAADLEFAGKDILRRFNHEPGIAGVSDAAIRYADVHPDKIKRWYSAAKKKALLPDVSVGLDRHITDYWHWDSGTNPDTLQKGKDTVVWDVTMSWDLGEIIWNNDQTGIDTRSRLMVQLRDDILDEITRTYFERRRLQIETYLSPPDDLKLRIEKELRIQELTADLDALTGGYFSSQIENSLGEKIQGNAKLSNQ